MMLYKIQGIYCVLHMSRQLDDVKGWCTGYRGYIVLYIYLGSWMVYKDGVQDTGDILYCTYVKVVGWCTRMVYCKIQGIYFTVHMSR